jgi:5-methyltetrahydrofolate--homocysteine methyltransferase
MGTTASSETSPYLAALGRRVLLFDGAMGTSLQTVEPTPEQFGGERLDGWIDGLVLHSPELIAQVHRSMLEAGADVIETCSFQATRLRLAEWGQADRTFELNRSAAELARRVCEEFATPDRPRFVAGSVGPTGFLPASSDPALGNITFAALVEAFEEQCRGLVEGGADLLIIETQQDLLETKAAIFGARRAFAATGTIVPVQVTVSLDVSGRMLLGTDIGAVLAVLDGLGVDVVGLNCSTGPEHMRDAMRYLGECAPMPIACIPNAGLPLNVGGKAHFPLEPGPMADQLLEFVERFGVNAVGGCCGSTPDHIRELRRRLGDQRAPLQRTPDTRPRLASSMSAIDLEQEPRPMLIGERVNSQGSRKIKELLLDDDYDGILGVARHQVEGGAHALDVCVALTERTDEDRQMHAVVKSLQMSVDTPLVIDSTDADVIRAALETYPGRGIVNSVNLENGRARCEAVLPLVHEHGQCVVALTIDEQGMATTRERKLEVAQRIVDIAAEFGVRREQILFDALTFTLATGDAEWVESAVETIEGIRLIKRELPGVLTVLGVSNVSFGLKLPARAVINSVFLHHCVEAGLDAAIINPAHTAPYAEIPDVERNLAEDLIFNRSEGALAALIEHFEGATATMVSGREDPFAGLPPAERIHQQILHRKKDGIEEQIDLALEERTPVEVLNDVLLPAMKDVGDRFGAGELILPFVLQSAEVMKRAVAHVEQFLEKKDGSTKGRVVLATVFGDVHDIGKNLVNTILSNNGYTVHDLGKQVPLTTIIEKAIEVEADVIGLSALLVSTSKQMPLMLQELERRGLRYPVIIGGAAINRGFGRRILFVDEEKVYDPGVYYCKDAFEGLDTVDQLTDPVRRDDLMARIREEAHLHRQRTDAKAAAAVPAGNGNQAARSDTRTDVDLPVPPFWGAQTVESINPQAVYPHIDRNSLFKMSWQFKGVHDKARWDELVRDELEPRLQRSMREAQHEGWLELKAVYGYWPALAHGNDVVVYHPEDHDREIGRFSFPRQGEQNRLCLADYVRPAPLAKPGERDVIALQLVTTGPKPSELSNRLQREGDYDDMLRVHGFATQMAEATAEYIHAHIRRELGLDAERGRRYSWGYPACPDLEDHETFFRIVPADSIGVQLTEGFQLVPEQSTAAIVLHHPQARYFAVYSGRFDDMLAELRGAPEPTPIG